MHLFLTIETGPEAGRQIELRPDESLEVGRGAPAQLAIAADRFMSRRHLTFTCEGGAWRVCDCNSRNGLFLNGEPIHEAPLCNGDRILAGSTTFWVRFEPGTCDDAGWSSDFAIRPELRAAPAAVSSGRAAPAVTPLVASFGRQTVDRGSGSTRAEPTIRIRAEDVPRIGAYTRLACPNGLVLYRAASRNPSPSVLAHRLSRECPLYLLADLVRLEREVPPELDDPWFLFPTIPDDRWRACAPILLPTGRGVNLMRWLEYGWGENALVALFSDEDPQVLVGHLRRVLAGHEREGHSVPPGRLTNICWPHLLESLLAHADSPSAEFLTRGIEAILLEAPEPPHPWQVFSGKGFAKALTALGMAEAGRP